MQLRRAFWIGLDSNHSQHLVGNAVGEFLHQIIDLREGTATAKRPNSDIGAGPQFVLQAQQHHRVARVEPLLQRVAVLVHAIAECVPKVVGSLLVESRQDLGDRPFPRCLVRRDWLFVDNGGFAAYVNLPIVANRHATEACPDLVTGHGRQLRVRAPHLCHVETPQ